MEIVYYDKKSEYFPDHEITGFYGDVLDLIKLNINISGINYNDEWTVKRFLKGKFKSNKTRIEAIFKYLELDDGILKEKIKNISKTDFKFVLLAKILLLNKKVIVFDYFDVGLTYKDQKRLIKIIRSLKKDGKTIVIISKDLVFMSLVVSSVLIFKDSQIVYNGKINDLDKTNLADNEEIVKFIKAANKVGARLDFTFDVKELLKDIYRSVY